MRFRYRAYVVRRKARCRSVPFRNAIIVERQGGARHAVGLLLDDTDEAIERFRQRTSGCDHLEHLLPNGPKRLVPAPLGDVS